MTQFYSRNDVNYNGDVYSIPFPYMKEEEIQVYLDGVLFTDWFFLQDTQLRLRSIPAGTTPDTIVSVRRVTNIDNKVVTYTNNTLLNKENLNLSQDQLLFAVQELYDNNTQFQIDTAEVIETNKQELLDIQEAFEQETQQQLLQNKTEIENRVTQFENEVNNTIDEVKEAANKVNQLEEAVDTAVTAANTATEQAEIAINKANETTEIVEQFTENIDSKISTNNENMQSVLAETEAVLQETKDTLDDTLNKSQITNCLLEVPQNIKLELNNGTLTLKAGSKVIVPNGAGVFDEVVITSDKYVKALTEGSYALIVSTNGSSCSWSRLDRVCSGASDSYAQVTYHTWYDTTNNIVKTFSSDVSKYAQQSLPVCIFTSTTDGVQSIDQVFNGMGYIGSTIWVDKGVKGLIPNGRNEDGTLRNIEWTNDILRVRNYTSANKSVIVSLRHPQDIYYNSYPLSITETSAISQDEYIPTGSASFLTEENIWRGRHGSITYDMFWIVLGGFNTNSSGTITTFDSKQPFRAVDYNEFKKLHVNNPYFFGQYIWSEFAPDNLSWLKSSGQWNSGYTSFYNWVLANAKANKAGFKLSTASYTDYDFVVNTSAKTFRLPIKVKQKFFNSGDVPVVGNGKTLGVQSNDNTVLSLIGSANGVYNLANYDSVRGSTPAQNSGYVYKTLGVTTDASKSGLVAKLSSVEATGLSLYFYVGETVRDEFLIDVAQIASNFADKIGRTECKAYITQTYVNGTSGYRIWSDKYCEQWGISTGAMPETVTLLKPYKDTNGNILITPKSSSTPTVPAGNPIASWISNSKIKVSSSQNNWAVFWETKGYVA